MNRVRSAARCLSGRIRLALLAAGFAIGTFPLASGSPLLGQSPPGEVEAGSPGGLEQSSEAVRVPTLELAARYPIVPWPRTLAAGEGHFVVDERSRISVSDRGDEELLRLADLLAGWIHRAILVDVPIITESLPEPEPLAIALILDAPAEGAGAAMAVPDGPAAEAYALTVKPEGVVVRAATHTGLFYGLQTLRQLLPPEAETPPGPRSRFRIELPEVEIDDAPRFAYRGLHLDVGRHFFPVDFIKRYLDLMAIFKMNRFHWHLTEDQGWRIEIEGYPRLAEVAAFRSETLIGHAGDRPPRFDGQPYGGFYTQDEVREVVRYAAERGITIVPEIELPGHSIAALAAYPELACTDGPFEVGTVWGVYEDIYCPSEETFEFLEGVLTEVMELFPGEYIHIGGDEAPKARWRESPVAQEVIRREGLADEDELQSWFVRRIERFLNENGRRLVGWDEITEGGLSPTSTVMYWRDWAPGVLELAASQGNDMIMTPNGRLYFDHYQGDPEHEPLAFGGLSTLEDVYAYEPIPETFTPEQARLVLGAQGNVWTEYMKVPEKVEYMVYPRAIALAEVVWSSPEARDLAGFMARLDAILQRLDALGVNYRKPPEGAERQREG